MFCMSVPPASVLRCIFLPLPVSVAGVERTFSRSDIMFPDRLNGLAALSIEDQLAQCWTLGTQEVILPRRKFANTITLTICIFFPCANEIRGTRSARWNVFVINFPQAT